MSTSRPGKPNRTPSSVLIPEGKRGQERPRQLVKIAPKELQCQSFSTSDGRPFVPKPLPKPRRRCRVPHCPIRDCRLQTHHAWKPPCLSPSSSSSSTGSINAPQDAALDVHAAEPIARSEAERVFETPVLRNVIEALPYDPLASLQKPAFKRMFHRFYLEVWDRITSLVAPPARSTNEAGQLKVQKSKLLMEAIDEPACLLNFVATTYLYLTLREIDNTQSKDFFQLQVELVKHLRQRLEHFHTTDVEQLLRIVLTLVMMEVTYGRNPNTLRSHRKAMIYLVESRGGLHNLGKTIPYVTNLDRLISLYIDETPRYCPWIDPTIGIQRVPRHPRMYGSFFEDDLRAGPIDPDIKWYCSAACRAIEILEGEDWYFSPGQICDSSELWYFYFLRDQIVGNYAHLNARFCRENSTTRCIMLASKIVDYSVLLDGFMVTLPLSLADRLRDLLQRQVVSDKWQDMNDVLRWALWVLLVYPTRWHGHAWALELAKQCLDLEYGTVWPSAWIKLELLSVRRFVWSNRRAESNFVRACHELWKLSAGRDVPQKVLENDTHTAAYMIET